jgi:anti-sigma B factor antagonist
VSAEPLTVTLSEPSPGVAVVGVAGEVDLGTTEQVEAALAEVLGEGRRVVVDLSACDFIDSSGLRTLVTARAAAEDAGDSFALVTDNAGVLRVLSVAALDRVFEIHRSLEDALTAGD